MFPMSLLLTTRLALCATAMDQTVPLKSVCQSPNPSRDCTGERASKKTYKVKENHKGKPWSHGTGIPRGETPEISLSLHHVRTQRSMAVSKPGRKLSPETKPCWNTGLGLPRAVRHNFFCLFKPPSLCYFVTAAWDNLDNHWIDARKRRVT